MKAIKLGSRLFVFASLVVGGALLPALTWARPVGTQFNVNGTCETAAPLSGNCMFTGVIFIDTSTGTVDSWDVDPGSTVITSNTGSYGNVVASNALSPGWELVLQGIDGNPSFLTLDFSTTIPGSLIGFTGGTISSGNVDADPYGLVEHSFSGTIGPQTPVGVSVPEPGVLGIFGLGVLLIGLFAGMRGRMA